MLFRSDCEADELKTLCMEGLRSVLLGIEIMFRRLTRGFTFRAISLTVVQLTRGLGLVDAISQPHDFQPWHGAACPGLP